MMDGADDLLARKGKVDACGLHLIIELRADDGLDDQALIETALRRAALAAGARILHIHLHRFSPQGITGVALLAESHITVHTWPERNYAAFDVFMCGEATPWAVVDVLKEAFLTEEVTVRALPRGPLFP